MSNTKRIHRDWVIPAWMILALFGMFIAGCFFGAIVITLFKPSD